jgi:hypothetical protein
MKNGKVEPSDLTPGAVICVTGDVVFSHISKHCTQQEAWDRAEKSKFRPADKSQMRTYAYLQVCNAQIVRKDTAAPLTLEEQYIQQSMFTSQKNPGANFTGTNSSKHLPRIYDEPDKATKKAALIQDAEDGQPAKELAKNLPVLLTLKVFKGNGNNGVALESVICRKPAEFYKPNKAVDSAVLDQFGIILDDSNFSKEDSVLEEVDADSVGEMIDANIGAEVIDNIATSNPAPTAPAGDTPFGSTSPDIGVGPNRVF